MEDNSVILEYNTERTSLAMPEYGRNVQKMVEYLKTIEDKTKRTEQAKAVVRVMELLNPSVHTDENWEHRLWDHLYIMADFNLDVESPYPVPSPENLNAKPMTIPLNTKAVKASHYGRNIENIIDLIANEPDCENKVQMLRSLAIYMRQQYLIWNKDSVADSTIFEDIEKLSEYRISVPEDMKLSKLSLDQNFSRPSMNMDFMPSNRKNNKRNFQRKKR